jgi:hypothetical protein
VRRVGALAAVGQEARVDQVRRVAGLAAVVLARQVQRQPAHDVRLVLEITLRCARLPRHHEATMVVGRARTLW